ncbi:hypothetical protein HW537_05015 [Asaia siamensis]
MGRRHDASYQDRSSIIEKPSTSLRVAPFQIVKPVFDDHLFGEMTRKKIIYPSSNAALANGTSLTACHLFKTDPLGFAMSTIMRTSNVDENHDWATFSATTAGQMAIERPLGNLSSRVAIRYQSLIPATMISTQWRYLYFRLSYLTVHWQDLHPGMQGFVLLPFRTFLNQMAS